MTATGTTREDLRLVIAPDRLTAVLEVPAGLRPDLIRLRRMIDDAGVRYGIQMHVLRKAMSSETGDRQLEVALGDRPTGGRGEHMQVEPDLSVGDALEQGQVVGQWLAAEAGEPGMGVDGQPVPAVLPEPEVLGDGFVVDDEGVVHAARDGELARDDAGLWLVRDHGSEMAVRRLETIKVGRTDDGMRALIRLEAGEYIMAEDLKRCVIAAGVRHGLQPDAIRAAFEPQAEARTLVVAAGHPPVDGEDCSLEQTIDESLHFDTNPDGSIDFHSAHSVKEVQAGDLLLKMHPATAGVEGMSVTGHAVPANDGRTADIASLAGDGAFVPPASPDEIRAERSGVFQKRRNGVIEVVELLLVDGDLDLETGNIETAYPVLIKGDVKAGFSVKSEGDITVNGVIEDARISAGGNLIVRNGILPGKERVKAHADIAAPYIRGRVVKATNVRVAKSLRQCEVYATGGIETQEILGGHLVAAESILATVVGNEDEPKTVLQAGVDPFKRSLYEKARAQLLKLDKEGEALKMRVESSAQRANELSKKTKNHAANGAAPDYLRSMVEKTKLAVEDSREIKAQYDTLIAAREEAESVVNEYLSAEAEEALARVSVAIQRNVFPGAEFYIGRHAHVTIDKLHRASTWVLKDGAVISL